MHPGLKKTLLLVGLSALVAFAYAPLLRAGLVGADLPVLAEASRVAWPHSGASERAAGALWSDLATSPLRPLAAASLALSSRLWSRAGAWSGSDVVWLRAENLLLLLIAGWMVGRTVRRALVPWYGTEVARSASWASAMILVPHPLCVAAVASPMARGDLWALALGATSALLFLGARQDRAPARMYASLLVAVLTGLASDLALFLPFALCALEFASARRHRASSARLRTAATTFVVFAALASIDVALSTLLDLESRPARLRDGLAAFAHADRAIAALGVGVEKLGVSMLPVPPGIDRAVGYALAGLTVLVALQPAFVAARSAPRLWGWILFAWTVAIGLALCADVETRVLPADLANACVLFPTAVVMSAGFAVTSTAVSGLRRALSPLAIGAMYAVLAHTAAEAWPRASQRLDDLRHDVAQARELHGRESDVLVIDPPGRVAGLEVIGDSLPWLADRRFAPDIAASASDLSSSDAQSSTARVIGLSRAALFALAREPEFVPLRQRGVVLLLDGEEVRSDRPPTPRTSLALTAPEASSDPLRWRADATSPVLNVGPSQHRVLRVTGLPSTSTAESPRMGWRSRSSEYENGAQDGVWLAGEDGPVALFDLTRSLAWLAGKRIRRIYFERGLPEIVSAELLPDALPLAIDGAPRVRGDAWVFAPPSTVPPKPVHGEARWIVGTLDLARYRYAEFESSATDPELVFPGVPTWERAISSSAGGPIVWTLEYRVGDSTVARASGRRRPAH